MSVDIPVEDNIAKAAELAAHALLHTPTYVEMFRGTEEERLDRMRNFFLTNLGNMYEKNPESLYFILDSEGELDCFFMLVPSGLAKITWWDYLLYLGLIWECGYGALVRMLTMGKVSSAHQREVTADYPQYLSLQRMVVNTKKHGQGIGSKSLNKVLTEVADKLQLPVILSTQEERNVSFYKRLNFKIAQEYDYTTDSEEYNFHTWYMVREPQPLKDDDNK